MIRITRARIGRLLVLAALVLAVTISVGGGVTYVALGVTTTPEFCASCHIMEPYVASWRASSHSMVACVDCHYEPGLLETFEGKFKAMSQLAKYVTDTQGTKPWAEVSDLSCMRGGCHSNHLLEGEIQYNLIKFDHRHHLIGLQRGKELRCTSCHSQLVQGEHISVTPRTCILCHFRQSDHHRPLDDCNMCHGAPKDAIELGSFTFLHSDYLSRGVACASCHGDVTRGEGGVPRQRCGSCHNQEQHLERYEDIEFLHRHHVSEHSVNCFECHDEIQHSLPPRSEHFQGECSDCHRSTHETPSGIYQGRGGVGVEDDPGIMFLARVTCRGCHRPPFEGAPIPTGGATYAADALACLDCHGVGYDGMVEQWQAETRGHVSKVEDVVRALGEALARAEGNAALDGARASHTAAAHNLGLVLMDRSFGAHNLPYVRTLLQRAADEARAGVIALDPDATPPPTLRIGPATPSEMGCTTLCHVGMETRAPADAGGYAFPHAPHLQSAGMGCSDCHEAEPHGTTTLPLASCAECHHPDAEDEEQCIACHGGVGQLRLEEPDGVEPSAMAEFDCLTCHESIVDGHDLAAVQAGCDDCHEDDGPDFSANHFAAWVRDAAAPLRALETRLVGVPFAQAARIRKEIQRLDALGPFHNPAWIRWRAAQLAEGLEEGD